APLLPAYISTVDSGNLAGALITLAAGLRGLAGDPQSPRTRRDGLADAAALALDALPPGLRGAPIAREIAEIEAVLASDGEPADAWARLRGRPDAATIDELEKVSPAAAHWARTLADGIAAGPPAPH